MQFLGEIQILLSDPTRPEMSETLKPGRSATRHEPAAHAFQIRTHAYPADAAANTSFSRGGLGSAPQLRKRYDDAIAQATLAGTRAAAGITEVDGESMRNIATVQRLIPVYTGLVESARANARQGNPVGVAYLAGVRERQQGVVDGLSVEVYPDPQVHRP